MVAQYYDTDVNKEYAIRGNSAILKCVVPSFVADFVKVLSWHTDQGEEFVPGDDYGRRSLALSIFLPTLASRSFSLSRTREEKRRIPIFEKACNRCMRESRSPYFSSLFLPKGGSVVAQIIGAHRRRRRQRDVLPPSLSSLTPFASLSPLPPSPLLPSISSE